MTTLDKRFAQSWAHRYEARMGALEPRLLSDVGPAAAARGYYEPGEFALVAGWKTARSKSRIASNADDDVRDITRIAFDAPFRFQHRVLTLLAGVRDPTATALLAVAFPKEHTIIDVRSEEALARLGHWDGSGHYLDYVATCRGIAERLDVDLRTLDRALWQWSKDRYPAELPTDV